MDLERPEAPDPYSLLPQTASLTVTSETFADGDTLPDEQVYNDWGFSGGNTSPQLSWSGAPEGTKGYVVTCFDPDAPTPCGFWHWLLLGIPADVTSLDLGAGDGKNLPAGAFHARNDFGDKAYDGAAPPVGDRPHRYMFAVHAVGDDLGLDDSVSGAVAMFTTGGNLLARGVITATYQAK
ncbi:YbhB/YbcL family Raf kinase inhibitor-like protein [Flexivirga sp. B27]